MNYHQRKDHRTDKQFKKEIADSTRKELYLVHRWQLEVQLQGKLWSTIPYGLDVTGKINKGKQKGTPDFKLLITDNNNNTLYIPLEVKNTPVLDKCTFKKQALFNTLQHNSYILLFLNTGQITKHSIAEMDLSKAYWALIKLNKLISLYEDYKDKVFRWKPFGNKEVIQILQKDYDKYFELNRFEFQL